MPPATTVGAFGSGFPYALTTSCSNLYMRLRSFSSALVPAR